MGQSQQKRSLMISGSYRRLSARYAFRSKLMLTPPFVGDPAQAPMRHLMKVDLHLARAVPAPLPQQSPQCTCRIGRHGTINAFV
jgi:hypothetical protein